MYNSKTSNKIEDLGHESCWNLDEVDTAKKSSSSKATHVTNDSASKGNKCTTAIQPSLNSLIEDLHESTLS